MSVCRQPGETLAALHNRRRFDRTTAADASGAARTRSDFAGWLQRNFSLDDQRRSDLVLAANEALSNAAEFGYRNTAGQGTIALSASYNEDIDTLTVTVTDRGRWRLRVTAPVQPAPRGRGIALMRALADETRILTSQHGTQICLTWANLLTASNRAPSSTLRTE